MRRPGESSMASMSQSRPRRVVLVAMFQGGGNIPRIPPILSRLVSRGHRVRVIVGPALAKEDAAGAAAEEIESIVRSEGDEYGNSR